MSREFCTAFFISCVYSHENCAWILLTEHTTSAPCGAWAIDLNIGKAKAQFFEITLQFSFSKTHSTHLHTPLHCNATTAHSALQSDDEYRSHAACTTQSKSAPCRMQGVGLDLETIELQLFQNSPCNSAETIVWPLSFTSPISL